ncbi:MAG: hypothetical protein F6J86_31275 [Symploca sp. SIO1B1]|nr:hypothetical protein [Symploca sp. SIO1B1]
MHKSDIFILRSHYRKPNYLLKTFTGTEACSTVRDFQIKKYPMLPKAGEQGE